MTITHVAGHAMWPRPTTTDVIEWAVASASPAGEVEPGSRAVVKALPHGVLVAVIDGLGHPNDAAVAARHAAATLELLADERLCPALRCCHEELSGTHGAAMTVARFDARSSTMEWVGVGNVDAVLVHPDADGGCSHEHVMLRGGVVGYRLPPIRPQTLPVAPGDTLVLATDGILPAFSQELDPVGEPHQLAEHILAVHGRDRVDSLALVARYRGAGP